MTVADAAARLAVAERELAAAREVERAAKAALHAAMGLVSVLSQRVDEAREQHEAMTADATGDA